ncbi:MAG: molybdopterin-dependent oxidoreductase [Actinomycetales bacterium]|nr:molybdopterin-dependent oxidoreductase [Actinomycetales bacterium]
MTRPVLLPAAAGLAAVALGVGAGELAAALFAPNGSPVTSVGGAAIDLAPPWAKEFMIAVFGTGDKAALLTLIGLLVAVIGGLAGVVEHRRPPLGRSIIGLGALLGLLAAVTRAGSGVLDALPSVVAGVAATIALTLLLRVLPVPATARGAGAAERGGRASASAPAAPPARRDLDRRRFLAWAGGSAAVGVLAAAGGFAIQAGSRVATAVRETIKLPTPVTSAPPVPAGAELGIDGLAPVVTPNEVFYRIDTALAVPRVNPADWSLAITGLVDTPFTLGWDELLALPMTEHATTLMCVSNPVGGDLIGNAVWLGYPIRELLRRAGPQSGADMVLSRSVDGWTASTPLEVLLDDDRECLLAIGMNGQPLPAEHGFPVRMVVPGLYGYVSATKWVTEMKLTRFADETAYWTDRGWSPRGPVKLQSRIDVPATNAELPAGEVVVAGVAWQQHVGVAGVEVQVDGGAWRPAELAEAISDDTWVQWRYVWEASPGDHILRCRAISATGEVQTGDVQGVIPDGATGWAPRLVTVS